MKTGKMVYVVMVNDYVDSVWTEETKASKRGNKLYNSNLEQGCCVMFVWVCGLFLNKKGRW